MTCLVCYQSMWKWRFQVILIRTLSGYNVSLISDSSFWQAEMVHTGLKLERALLVTASQCQQPAGVSSLLVGFLVV